MIEQIEDLQFENLKIVQPKCGYRFTSDSVILANFVKAKSDANVIEFCSGCGVISTLVLKKLNLKQIFGIELQPSLFALAQKSIKLNNLENKITFINDKIQNYLKYFKHEQFDVVVCNPPYYKVGSGAQNENQEINIAKNEIHLTLDEFLQISSTALKFGGNLYFCHNANRLFEIFINLKKFGLTPKEMFFSQGGEFANPTTVFIRAQKGARSGIKVFPNLITNKDGNYIATIKKLFN